MRKFINALFIPACWFAPASFLRVFFHKLRGVKIGRGVEIGYMVIIDHVFPQYVRISNNVTISAGVKILAHDDAYSRERLPKQVNIKQGVFIGVNTVVMPGITIDKDSVIGAQSLVNKNIPAQVVVAGVPVKFIKGR